MHPLDAGRRDPDLVGGTREGQEVERRGVELDREPVLDHPAGEERVGAHGGADHGGERTEQPVLVEARHRVDPAPERVGNVRGIGRRVGIESRVEELDDRARGLGIVRKRGGERRVREPDTRLVQVLRHRAQDDDVARRETGRDHEAIEPVVLDRPAPHSEEQLGDPGLEVGIVEPHARRRVDSERVDPAWPIGRVGSRDLVGTFVDDHHVELVEHRHHVGEHQRRPDRYSLSRARPSSSPSRSYTSRISRSPAGSSRSSVAMSATASSGETSPWYAGGNASPRSGTRRGRPPHHAPPGSRRAARRSKPARWQRAGPRARPGRPSPRARTFRARRGAAPSPTRRRAPRSPPKSRQRRAAGRARSQSEPVWCSGPAGCTRGMTRTDRAHRDPRRVGPLAAPRRRRRRTRARRARRRGVGRARREATSPAR